MKKLLYIFFIVVLLWFTQSFAADMCAQVIQDAKNSTTWECKSFSTPCDVPTWWEKVTSCDNLEDNQLTDIEDKSKVEDLKVNFKPQNFSSCQNLEDVVSKYIKNYYKFYPNKLLYRWWVDYLMEDSISSAVPVANKELSATDSSTFWWGSSKWATDFSQTNIQVAWVDESEIVKTDWKNLYYYNSSNHLIYIVKAFPSSDMQILKTIKVPASFSDPELYISWNKLTIVSNKYMNGNFGYYWFNRNSKTVVVTYDISNLAKLKIDKYYQVDWSVSKSRKIGKYLYVLSQSNFNFPYATYYGPMIKTQSATLDTNKIDEDMDAKRLLPKKAELRAVDNIKDKNVNVKWTDVNYNFSQWYTSKCVDIEFVMPDDETLKKFDFTPSYVTLSVINTEDVNEEVTSKLLFWDVNEIYMSQSNLYITSNLYTSYNFKCGFMGCMMPYYNSWNQTLVHKMSLNGKDVKYVSSNIIPGSPLNQYSMDENSDWYFRIVTSNYIWTWSTSVYVLDKNLKLSWKLDWIWLGENFQSSRFIWNKLYLVTFKQIDPLFVIDLSSNTNPKILWELKMPGYSTYLHPYDENHLIWLWYDTKVNQWWWTQNNWLKIDLYDVSDIKNPKQQYSLTLWDQSSYSDVLNNPRLFSWYAKEKILFLPATLYKNAWDKTNPYRSSDVFQWWIAVKIDTDSWIKELSRVTHIDTTSLETKRQEDCKQYQVEAAPKCVKLIWGWEYCPAPSTYIPTYCYEWSAIWEYLANQIWNYNDSFVLRNLYLDNLWYTVSNTKIQANDIKDNFNKVDEVKMK